MHGALVHLPVALQHAASLQREVLQRRLRRRDHEHHLPVDHPQRSPLPSAWHRGACRHKVPAPWPRLRLPRCQPPELRSLVPLPEQRGSVSAGGVLRVRGLDDLVQMRRGQALQLSPFLASSFLLVLRRGALFISSRSSREVRPCCVLADGGALRSEALAPWPVSWPCPTGKTTSESGRSAMQRWVARTLRFP